MLKLNRNYVIEKDGSIHEMIFVGDSDWDEKSTTSIQEIRNEAIDEMVNGIREILECNAIYNIDCISTLAEQLRK